MARVENCSRHRPQQHPRDGPRGIAMFAQQVADTRAVSGADVRGIVLLARMVDHERRVVLDPRTAVEGANQIVDLLTRR